MRALLIVNPTATTTTARTRDVLVHALQSDLKMEVATTTHRDHALQLAAQARADGLDLVIALGGDGTVNEAVNGLLAEGPGEDVPMFAVVPGGSTNVFARAMGVPNDAIEAAGLVLEALRERRHRSIGLGKADSRWFTFCAGLGLDAEVIGAVEDHRADGRTSTPSLYVRSAVTQFYRGTDRDRPALTLSRPGHPDEQGIHLAIIQNTRPWTYIGDHPVDPCPLASFDTGLDMMALRGLGTLSTLRHVRQMLFGRGRPPHGRTVISLHDESEVTLWAARPTALQIDGDHLGERMSVRCRSVPGALRVLV